MEMEVKMGGRKGMKEKEEKEGGERRRVKGKELRRTSTICD